MKGIADIVYTLSVTLVALLLSMFCNIISTTTEAWIFLQH